MKYHEYKYHEYVECLIDNIKCRFVSDTTSYDICNVLRGLFDFTWLIKPTFFHKYSVSDIEELSVSDFVAMMNKIHFSPKSETDLHQLLFEYRLLWKFAYNSASKYRLVNSLDNFTVNVLKQFVFS